MSSSKLQEANNPFKIFNTWYQEALRIQCKEPTAMILATANNKGMPSARVVLLKNHSAKGFVFFTNIESRKGKELLNNPNVSLVFYWMELSKQVRVEGTIEFLPSEEIDSYYASRSRGSQLGAIASKQSQVLASWSDFITEIQSLEMQYANKNISRPSYWVGLKVIPSAIEFWQEGKDRLHTRYLYTKVEESWKREQLYP